MEFLKSLPSFDCGERRDILRENPQATTHRLVNAAVEFNLRAVNDFGGRLKPHRGKGLIEQGIGAAFQTFDGQDIHPSDWDKAGMLLRGIIAGHPFEDGNKRTGFLLASYFLSETGHQLPDEVSEEDVVSLCKRVSSGEVRDSNDISTHLKKIWLNHSLDR